jgi:3-oxoacyl-[acyl-carrier protein] reductase
VNNSSPFDLTGRSVLVTGALGGLGREMVRGLAEAGASIVVHHYREEQAAEELVACLHESGTPAAAVEGDVTDWEEAAAFVAEAQAALGPLEVLVNNAGFMAPGKITEMTLDEWRKTLSVDLDGVFIVSRHVLLGMLQLGRGVIVNVSSQLAFKGAQDYASYCAAKAGVLGLTKAMAREVGPIVRVNAVAPGPILTPMTASTFSEELTLERTAGSVARRMGESREIAPAVVFLASDASSFMHGQTMHLNGGGIMP